MRGSDRSLGGDVCAHLYYSCQKRHLSRRRRMTWVTPLLSVEDLNEEIPAGAAPGALGAPAMAPPLNIVDCCQ